MSLGLLDLFQGYSLWPGSDIFLLSWLPSVTHGWFSRSAEHWMRPFTLLGIVGTQISQDQALRVGYCGLLIIFPSPKKNQWLRVRTQNSYNTQMIIQGIWKQNHVRTRNPHQQPSYLTTHVCNQQDWTWSKAQLCRKIQTCYRMGITKETPLANPLRWDPKPIRQQIPMNDHG